MRVVAYNATCARNKSAIHKFIIILIGFYQVQLIIGGDKLYIAFAQYYRHDIAGNFCVCLLLNNL